jgi:hypothetical protein
MGNPYDPDPMNADDFDDNDLDQVEAWLNQPNTVAFHDDLAREFERLPSAAKVVELERHVATVQPYLKDIDAVLAREGPPRDDPRWELHQTLAHSIDESRRRIQELT